MKKNKLLILIFLFLFFIFSADCLYAASEIAEFLCDIGISYYKSGRYDYAIREFKKVLIIEPNNPTAKEYIDLILKQEAQPQTVSSEKIVFESPVEPERRSLIIQDALDKFSRVEQQKLAGSQIPAVAPAVVTQETKEEELKLEKKAKVSGIKLSGEVQMGVGLIDDDAVWKRANFDLNEKNWRMLSDAAFNRRENTYDPAIFDRLRVIVEDKPETGFGFHTNITLDPWSFTGKSDKVTVTSAWGDKVDVQLKYWSNTGYTIGEIVNTNLTGNSISIPELKVKDDKIGPITIPGAFSNAWGQHDQFTIPELKIHRQFQPLRELWVDYKQEDLSFKVFPLAYQDQAFTSDDPLRISNNHIWWEDSPWIRRWKPGNYNSWAIPTDFTKGYWDNSLSFFSRDSDGTCLTSLRGFSFNLQPVDKPSLAFTVATPQDLWQDYAEVDNVISALRVKTRASKNLGLGATYTGRVGFNLNKSDQTDARSHTGAVDLRYEIMEGVLSSLEVAHSESKYDLTTSQYKSSKRGNAYYFSLVGRYPPETIIDLEYGYDQIKPEKSEDFLMKYRAFGSHMDEGFDPAVSSYRNTRRDAFWSRHLHFRKPLESYFAGLYFPSLKWEDINSCRIGNGIDIGYDTIGLRVESIWVNKVENLFDIRNVHRVDGKYVETISRDEFTWYITDKLTSKLLGIYQDMPHTKAGIDPFIYSTKTSEFLYNSSILDGKDPSLKTGSLGLEYVFREWLSLNGVWEHTNDYCLAYDKFPSGVLNDSLLGTTYTSYGNIYRTDSAWLYDQYLFPLPPYSYYDIYKLGLRLTPIEKMQIYLDYTRNEFESAGQIDDNMNHIGLEIAYYITNKFGFYNRYTYSRWQDLDRLRNGITKPRGHHNFFSELRYTPSQDDELVLQYGISGRQLFTTVTTDPFGGGLSSIDTQHITRLFYRRKF
jgi:hypothetical protein